MPKNCTLLLLLLLPPLLLLLVVVVVVVAAAVFAQGIYHFIPEIMHVSRVHKFPDILWLQFMEHVMLFLL